MNSTVISAETRKGASIQVRGVNQVFVRDESVVEALRNIDLSVGSGEFVALIGPSGCGKTTLLNMMAGMLTPTEGSVEIDGQHVREPSDAMSYMLARDALLPWRTAQANIEFALQVRKVERSSRRAISTDWLTRVGLEDFAVSRPHELSQGMRQRVAIARTLSLAPRTILMDEPFAALDAQTRIFVQQEFLDLWERERPTVVFVTHDLAEAVLLCDRIVLMGRSPGRIVREYEVNLPRPRLPERDRVTETFAEIYAQIWDDLKREFAEQAIDEQAVEVMSP